MYKKKNRTKKHFHKSKKQIQNKTQNVLKRIGGKMLASGGFGCVFRPALKCQGKTMRDPNKVSKLMSSKHANEELKEIENMKNKLMGIPNYQDYYLVEDFSICKPAELEKEDLQNFDKCHALSKPTSQIHTNDKNTHLTVNDVNNNLNDLLILNMPFGGIPIDDFVKNNISNKSLMNKLNDKLLELLIHGIVPLNRNHIYHNDIKDSNVLVRMNKQGQKNINMKTRLIDWGLSCSYKPNNQLPKPWANRPFQFNVPFSVILFTDLFEKSFNTFKNSLEPNR
jgi:serine/threonine protein kinase